MQQIRLPFLLFVGAIAAVVLILMGGQAAKHAIFRHTQESRAEALEAELATLRGRQADLQARIAYLKTDAYIESAAREQLGLIKPGETAVIVVVDEPPAEQARAVPPSPSTRDLSYPERWRHALFGAR